MPSIAQNSTVNISLAAGDYINLTGSGSWSYIATVSGREIASGTYYGFVADMVQADIQSRGW